MIRAIQETDLAEIIQIEQAAHSHPWALNQFSKRLNCARHLHAALVIKGKIYGYYLASQVAGEAELLNISVAPSQQGKGLGFKLLQHFISNLKAETADVFLEVRASNALAIKLYEKQGFHQLGCRPDYYPCRKHGREDALLYALSVQK